MKSIRTRYNSLVPALPSGTYRFGGTDFPFRPNTGVAFAAFLLGSVSNAEFTQPVTTWLPRWWSHAFYIQDDFKLFRNVTLNLGLRWSYESPFSTKYGFQSQFDPNAIDPITGASRRDHTSERRAGIEGPEQLPAARWPCLADQAKPRVPLLVRHDHAGPDDQWAESELRRVLRDGVGSSASGRPTARISFEPRTAGVPVQHSRLTARFRSPAPTSATATPHGLTRT